ncbi:MAG: glycine cleavage system protein GcvH [Spirochaetales bacterium]|nr:glycine cleavage system protein GcvH [Spirochaetales bacterium]
MNIPGELKYTREHEWVKVEEDILTIGITDFAQKELGDIVYVELPETDEVLKREEAFSTIESVKTASDIFMPVSGTIVEVNEDLEDNSAYINEDPYGSWIVKVKVDDEAGLNELMSAEEYKEFCQKEEK